MQPPRRLQARGIGTLARQFPPPRRHQRFKPRRQIADAINGKGCFHCGFTDNRLIGQAHAIGRKHAREGMDEHRFHAQFIGHQAGMLPACAAEALQGEASRVMAFLDRDLLDGIGHIGNRHTQKPFRDRTRIGRGLALRLADFSGQDREFLRDNRRIQRLITMGAENCREVMRLDFADHDIGIRHRERPAAPITGRPRHGASGIRTHTESRTIKMQNGTATGRHGIDRHHRCTHAHASDFGFKRAFKRAGVKRDIGGSPAHIKADDAFKPAHRRSTRRTDNAARGAGQDRILALEMPGFGQAAA